MKIAKIVSSLSLLGYMTCANATEAVPESFFSVTANHAYITASDQPGTYTLALKEADPIFWVRSRHSKEGKNFCQLSAEAFTHAITNQSTIPWAVIQTIRLTKPIMLSFATFSNTHYDVQNKALVSTITTSENIQTVNKDLKLVQLLVKFPGGTKPDC